MIKTREDLKTYLALDRHANACDHKRRPGIIGDDIWKFLISLRYCEFYLNTRPFGKLSTFVYFFWKLRNYKLANKCNFSIPVNVLGPGIRLPHKGTIVINSNAKIGKNCTIHVCVNIGASGGEKSAPSIGDDVYIGPGAKIFGDITIADSVMIGANAVVGKSIHEPGTVWVGVPARLMKPRKASIP